MEFERREDPAPPLVISGNDISPSPGGGALQATCTSLNAERAVMRKSAYAWRGPCRWVKRLQRIRDRCGIGGVECECGRTGGRLGRRMAASDSGKGGQERLVVRRRRQRDVLDTTGWGWKLERSSPRQEPSEVLRTLRQLYGVSRLRPYARRDGDQYDSSARVNSQCTRLDHLLRRPAMALVVVVAGPM